MAVAWIIAASLIVALFVELIRRLPPKLGAALFLVGPLIASPLWLADADAPLFSFVKVYSVCLGAGYIQLLKITSWVDRPWGRRIAYLILALNILEAVVTGARGGDWMNAIAGALLLVTQASPDAIRVERDSPRRDVAYTLGAWWVASYTLWNFTFVYHFNVEMAAFAVVHLAAPFLVARGRVDHWIQARAMGLSLAMFVRMTAPYPPFIQLTPEWESPVLLWVLRGASLGLAVFVTWRTFRHRQRSAVATA